MNFAWKASQIIEALQKVSRDATSKKTAVYKWLQRFREGREDLEDDPKEGRPSASRKQEIVAAVKKPCERKPWTNC